MLETGAPRRARTLKGAGLAYSTFVLFTQLVM